MNLLGDAAGTDGMLRAGMAFRQAPGLNAALATPQAEVFIAGARVKFDAVDGVTGADTWGFLARHMHAFADGTSSFGPAGVASGPGS